MTRTLPIPIREGRQVYVIMPDGQKVPIDPLVASEHMKAWVGVIGGLYVREETDIGHKNAS